MKSLLKSLKSQSVQKCALLKMVGCTVCYNPCYNIRIKLRYWSTQVVTSATTLGSSSWSTLQ